MSFIWAGVGFVGGFIVIQTMTNIMFGEQHRLERMLRERDAQIARLRAALDRAADALEFYDNKAEAQKARRELEIKPS